MNKVPHPRKHQFNVRLTALQMEELRRKAFDTSMSISMLIRQLLLTNSIISQTINNNP
jgi:hypothetical protein